MISPAYATNVSAQPLFGAKSAAQNKVEEYTAKLSGKTVNVLVRNEFSYGSARTNVMQLPRDAAYSQVIFTVEGDDTLYVLETITDADSRNGQKPVKKLYQARIGTTPPPKNSVADYKTNRKMPYINNSVQLDRMFRSDTDTVVVFDGKSYRDARTQTKLEALAKDLIDKTKTPTIADLADRYEALVRSGKVKVVNSTVENEKWGDLVTAYLRFPDTDQPENVYRLQYSRLKDGGFGFAALAKAIDPAHYEDDDMNSPHYGFSLQIGNDYVYDFEDRKADTEKVTTASEFGGRGYWWQLQKNAMPNGDYSNFLTNRQAEAVLKTLMAVVDAERN